MKISQHFDSSEFDSHDGTKYPDQWIEERLIPLCTALEKIRAKAKASIRITSGYRSKKHNKAVGGASNSQHVQGIAADIQAEGVPARKLYQIILKMIDNKEIPNGGVGSYRGWVHYDIRCQFGMPAARWRK